MIFGGCLISGFSLRFKHYLLFFVGKHVCYSDVRLFICATNMLIPVLNSSFTHILLLISHVQPSEMQGFAFAAGAFCSSFQRNARARFHRMFFFCCSLRCQYTRLHWNTRVRFGHTRFFNAPACVFDALFTNDRSPVP